MNVFEHAMKMEEDGRAYYLEQAKQAKTPTLRRILEELADDELKHYNIFRALRDRKLGAETEAVGTDILSTTKNVFDSLRDQTESYDADDLGAVSVWEHAREIEAKAENFYREQAAQVDGDEAREALKRIADEEHRHYIAIDSVVKFLSRPSQWLEDAEWSSMEE